MKSKKQRSSPDNGPTTATGRRVAFRQLVNAREGMIPGRNRELLSGSFFHERITTLGMLIGASNTLDLSMRSSSIRRTLRRTQKSNRAISNRDKATKPNLSWSFSACCRDSRDVEVVKNHRRATASSSSGGAPSLSNFLAGERRKSVGLCRMRQLNPGEFFGPYDGLGLTGLTPEWNTLFVDGRIAPPPPPPRPPAPRSSPWSVSDGDRGSRSSVISSWICAKQS